MKGSWPGETSAFSISIILIAKNASKYISTPYQDVLPCLKCKLPFAFRTVPHFFVGVSFWISLLKSVAEVDSTSTLNTTQKFTTSENIIIICSLLF